MVSRRDILVGGALSMGVAACAKPDAGTLRFADRRAALSGYAVNAESWWTDIPFEARFDAAAKAGFSHVEFWTVDGAGRDAKTLSKIIKPTGLSVAQIVVNAPALGVVKNQTAFLDAVKTTIEEAQILGTDIVTITGHQNIDGVARADAIKAYADNIAASAPLWDDAKIYGAVEPFNPYDHPGHFIYGHKDALDIVRAIGSDYVGLNWDLFHMQRHEGNLIANFEAGADKAVYVQLADSPHRGQPGTGEVDYAHVLRAVRKTYAGPIGLEFWAKDGNYDKAVTDMIALHARI